VTDPRWVVPAMFTAAAACFVAAALCGPAKAAERRYEIVLTEKPTLAEPDRVRTFVISEAYPSKDDCLRVLAGVRIKAPNARVRCLPKED
jgi:hypothetical protein